LKNFWRNNLQLQKDIRQSTDLIWKLISKNLRKPRSTKCNFRRACWIKICEQRRVSEFKRKNDPT
jgi:hypothetical protein